MAIQGDYLKKVYENGWKGVGFFNYNFGWQLFNRKLNNIIIAFAIACILMILYTSYLQSDHEIKTLIKSLTLGRREVLSIRAAYLILFSLIVGCIFYIPYYKAIWNNYFKQDFSLLIQSLERFENFPIALSIGQVFIISVLLKVLGILGITLFMYFLSMWNMKKSVYQVSVMALIFMPLILGFVDAPFNYLMFGGMFYGEELLMDNFYKTCVYVGVMVVGLIVFGVVSVRKYIGNWEKGLR